MDRATESVRFARGLDGCMCVSVPSDLRPLDDLLETDIGESLPELRALVERVRQTRAEPWVFAGDSCQLTAREDEVLIENDYTGRRVLLSRAEFLRIAGDFERAVQQGGAATGTRS